MPVRSPQPWRNLIIFGRTPAHASSSLVWADGFPIGQGQGGTGSVTNSHLPPQPKADMPKLKAKNGEE